MTQAGNAVMQRLAKQRDIWGVEKVSTLGFAPEFERSRDGDIVIGRVTGSLEVMHTPGPFRWTSRISVLGDILFSGDHVNGLVVVACVSTGR